MATTSPCRVMVMDDYAVIRGLLTKLLESDSEIEVVASSQNGEVAQKALERQVVDVAIADMEMPVMDGLTALPLNTKSKPNLKVIMASTLPHQNADCSLCALRAGASDDMPKQISASDNHVARKGTGVAISLNQSPPENFRRPTAEAMFRSMARVYRGRLLAVVLTGMGADGKKGAEQTAAVESSVIPRTRIRA